MSKEVHTHEWWLPYLDEYHRSGKTISDFCKENGLNYDAFYWQLRREKTVSCDSSLADIVVSSFSASRIRKNSKLNPMRPAGVLDRFRLI